MGGVDDEKMHAAEFERMAESRELPSPVCPIGLLEWIDETRVALTPAGRLN